MIYIKYIKIIVIIHNIYIYITIDYSIFTLLFICIYHKMNILTLFL